MAAQTADRPTGNRLLDRLPGAEFGRLRPHFTRVALRPPDEVQPAGQRVKHVFFPLGGVFSLRLPVQGGEVEITTVGREGLLGVAACFGLAVNPLRAVTRLGGECLRAPAGLFRAAPPGGPTQGIAEYLTFAWRKSHQMVACNLTHPIEARLPRLLLTIRDRTGADQFDLTQGVLAEMVGASRQTVTEVAVRIQSAGLIAYHRGRVRLLNPAGLESRACECYGVMRDFYEKVLG